MTQLPKVYCTKCDEYAKVASVFREFLHHDILNVGNGQRIVIKINMCDLKTPETGAVTDPSFLRAFIIRLRELYPSSKIVVAEADATVVFAEEFYRWIGYERALADLQVPFVNLSCIESTEKEINGLLFKSLPFPVILRDSYFISMSKLKTNVTSIITCSLKNQYPFVKGLVKSIYHDNVHRAIVDANLLCTPDFVIVDGVLGQGGPKAPAFGVPIRSRRVIFGRDPVAVDAYCSHLMSINPRFVPHVVLSQKRAIGSMKYELVGEPQGTRLDFEASLFSLKFFRMAGKVQRIIQAGFRRSAA